jgi:hypothetical protein
LNGALPIAVSQDQKAAKVLRCRVCLIPLRADGSCVYKCDPAMTGTARRKARSKKNRTRP